MSQEEFGKLYDKYSDAIFRFCFFKTSNREQALDIMQDTFMKAWTHISKGGEMTNEQAFLYKIAGNAVIDFHRKKKSQSLDAMQESVGFDVATDEHKRTPEILDGQRVINQINELPEEYRDVLLMRYVEDMKVKDIAESLGERENTISVRINRGLAKLKETFA